jgi:hypothetical protein
MNRLNSELDERMYFSFIDGSWESTDLSLRSHALILLGQDAESVLELILRNRVDAVRT